jgi:hypothetical protein
MAPQKWHKIKEKEYVQENEYLCLRYAGLK